MATTTTTTSLDTRLVEILKSQKNDSAYPIGMRQDKLNIALERIIAGTLEHPFDNDRKITRTGITHLSRSKTYKVVQPMSIGANINASTTFISLSSTANLPSAGFLWLNYNIIKYNSKTALGVYVDSQNPVNGEYEAGNRIYPLYELPTDYEYTTAIYLNGGEKLKSLPEQMISESSYQSYGFNRASAMHNSAPVCFLLRDRFILLLNMMQYHFDMNLLYQKKPAKIDLTSTTDIVELDDRYTHAIYYLAGYMILSVRGETDFAKDLKREAFEAVESMYIEEQNKATSLDHGRVRTDSDSVWNL